MSNPLLSIIEKGLPNPISKWPHYLPIYDKHFKTYKENASPENKIIIVEIGVFWGGSLDMWNEYFGKENCIIYGIDIDSNCKRFERDNIHIIIGDQGDKNFLNTLKTLIPQPDIIIDDGGHRMHQQINSFDILFSYLKMGGIYLCEDTHTSYYAEYDGGFRNTYSFVEHVKSLIDYIHGYHNNYVNHITKTCMGIYIYDSMIFFEKPKQELPKPAMQIWYPK